MNNNTYALFVRLEAKVGKETEVEEFLTNALPLVREETDNITWFALRLGESTFGIFDTFETEAGRDAHLSGQIAQALMDEAPDLFEIDPVIEKAEVLASKLPE